MALLQISEPGMSNMPHQKNIAIGIDLGTTNSLVATVKSGEATVLTNLEQESLIPSVVYYAKDGTVLVGDEALNYRVTDPENTIVSVKRRMGHTIDTIVTHHGAKNAVEVSSEILKKLKQIAVSSLGDEPVGCVITVPAYFDDASRQATKLAAQLANLPVLRLLNEPTAAAIAYGLDTKNEGVFLVYDLGGGTLDVSILRLTKGVFEVLAVSGDTKLGGDDFDQLLYNYALSNLSAVQINLLTDSDRARLLIASRAAKEALTIDDVATIDVIYRLNDQLNTINVTITRDQFDELSQTLLDRSMLPMKQALRDCGLEISAINEIIMVGGSTRMLSIRNQVSELFGRSLLTDIDPDRVVAIGAAIQADILVGNRRDDWLLLDVTPLSLGVETIGGLIEKIIPRNSTIPIARCQEFTTYKDGQTAMSIHVLQGERELVSDCKSLAKFSLKGIPPMVAGAAKIKITFQIDADGLLSVTAAEQTTGISSTIEVNPSFGLNETQIQAMLQASVINAKDDMMLRNLVEVETDSRALVDSIEAALVKDRSLLSDSEYKIIINAIDNVKNILDMRIGDSNSNNNPNDKNEDAYDITNNKNNIINEVNTKTLKLKDLNDKLNAATQDFAMRRMDLAVKSRLTGRSIKET